MEENTVSFIEDNYDTLYFKSDELCSVCGKEKVSFIFYGDEKIEKICTKCLKDKKSEN